ncbi:HAMP domain-containing sensor histidine kinase [Solibacillus sp. FSL K6-1523]|uniref:HAMP domain-containing sensor histidine kinase n=1 Tax=Solibacillus sp. FSL K6-1523 TaxID=2921471 RepID=UPI0030F55A87
MKTLYSKFILFTLATFLISATFSFLITNAFYHQVMKEKNDANYVQLATDITNYIQQHPPDSLEAYLTQLGQIGYQIYLADELGNSSFYGDEYRLKELPTADIDTVLAGETYHGVRDYPQQLFITGFFSNDLRNTVGLPFEYEGKDYALFMRLDIKLLFSEMHFIIAGFFIFIPVVSILAMVLAAWYLVKPIQRLSKATKLVASENFDAHIVVDRADEIGTLATNFNLMTKELKKQREIRKEFIRNVSHDFQTPLQSIAGYANLIQQQKADDERTREYGEIIARESDRLSHLTKQLLLWQSASKLAEQKEKIALDEVIKQVIKEQQFSIQRKNISVWMELEPLNLYGSEPFIVHAIDNLISNAVKYSEPGTEISVTGKIIEGQIELIVQDEGHGISEENITRIFEPFYRADESRSTPGTGLGLVIVKQVVEMHDGTIAVQSEKGIGTKFSMTFPIE